MISLLRLTFAPLIALALAAPSGPKSDAPAEAAPGTSAAPAKSAGGHIKASGAPIKAAGAAPRKAKAAPRPKIKLPAPRRETEPKPAPPAPPPPPVKVLKQEADSGIAPLGALGADSETGFTVTSVVPGSEAESMGIAPGDRLTHLFSFPVKTRRDAEATMRKIPSEGRLSAVAVRGLASLPLSGKPQRPRPPLTRGPDELSTNEMLLKEKRLAKAQEDAEAAVRGVAPQEFKIAAGQSLWIAFPAGIGSDAGPGDVVKGEATTAVCTDQSLDFLSLPPRTSFWAKVVEAHGPAETHNVRLFFFKMKLAGGSFYPIAARVLDVSGGDPTLVKTTPGGTIVMPNGQGVNPDMKVKVEFLEPVTLVEPPGFYSTGVGLWIKTRDDGPGYRISHIIPGRSAEAAGLQPGDVIMSIDGTKTTNFDFATAVSALYGRQESEVKLGVIRSGSLNSERPKTETLTLKRGVTLVSDAAVPLPPPYEGKGPAGKRQQ